ncbi:MAG: Gfo/Idh/MocA family protein [Alphaproteobacteria bacterium]
MTELRIGLIGAGWMGKTHAMCYRAAPLAFGGKPAVPVLEVLADVNEEIAARSAKEFGFKRHARDWRTVIEDPKVDIVDINTPNDIHFDIAMAAIAAGKHVYCEKPLANDAATAFKMAKAAEEAGVITMVGFNYIKNPVQTLARKLIADGEVGAASYYRGVFNSDFLGRPDIPFSWRNEKAKAGSGVIGDIGAHCFAYFSHLVRQPVEAVLCDLRIIIPERPEPQALGGFSQDASGGGKKRKVETDDLATVLFRAAGGVTGHMEMSRVSLGKRFEIGYDLTGTKGALRYQYDRINQLQLYTESGAQETKGFKSIEMGPTDPRFAAFFPVPGLGAGYNDYKVMEVQDLIEAVAAGKPAYPDFRWAAEVQRVIDACILSDAEQRWVKVSEIAV